MLAQVLGPASSARGAEGCRKRGCSIGRRGERSEPRCSAGEGEFQIEGTWERSEPSPKWCSKRLPVGGPGRASLNEPERSAPRKRRGAKRCKPFPEYGSRRLRSARPRERAPHRKPSPLRYSIPSTNTGESVPRSKPFTELGPLKTWVRRNLPILGGVGFTTVPWWEGSEPEPAGWASFLTYCARHQSEKRAGSAGKQTPRNSSLPAQNLLSEVTQTTLLSCWRRRLKRRPTSSSGACCGARVLECYWASGEAAAVRKTSHPIEDGLTVSRVSGAIPPRFPRQGNADSERWNVAMACGGGATK